MLARVVGVEMANQMPEPARTETLASLNSVWWGVGVSNVLVLLAASNPVSLIAGAMAGLGWWKATENEREFMAWCTSLFKDQPGTKCTYTTPG